jgi:hypothetical protein
VKRALLLALILVNLGVFAWVHWYVLPGHSEPAPSAAPGGQPLQLMSELTPTQKKAVASANAAPSGVQAPAASTKTSFGVTTLPAGSSFASSVIAAPPAATGPAQVCASYGPFPSADAASQALARLKTAGLTASQRELPGKAKRGYWVFLPPFRSRPEADAAAAMLKKRGVADIYVVPDEANRNAVSLGVFNQREFAVQREHDIKKLGFRAQMAERFRDEPRYWLDAKGVESALPAAEAFKDLSDEAAPIGKASTACAP